MKPLLVVGLDPGTTVGYAVLDIEGNILLIGSEKELDLSNLITKIISYGKPVAVGCDVVPAPEFVQKFATKLNCKLIEPERDLLVEEKAGMISEFKDNCKDAHQKDSLASALYAFQAISTILSKIVYRLQIKGKGNLLNDVINLVLTKDVSIQTALDILEKPEKEEVKLVKEVIEDKPLLKSDFLKLYQKMRSAEKELNLIKKQNLRLSKEAEETSKKDKFLLSKLDKLIPKEKVEQLLVNKDKTINALNLEINTKLKRINLLEKEKERFANLIFETKDKLILKRVSNLGSAEYNLKKDSLNIDSGDVLFVDDLDISSDNVISELKSKVDTIVYRKAGKKTLSELPFVAVDSAKLNLIEEKMFVLVDRNQFEKIKSQSNLLGKIVEEYKKERRN